MFTRFVLAGALPSAERLRVIVRDVRTGAVGAIGVSGSSRKRWR